MRCILLMVGLLFSQVAMAADFVEITLTVDGRERIYQYHLPPASCGSKLPVVMFLHGGGGTANSFRAQVGYATGDRNCYIEVFPEGVKVDPNSAVWTPGDCVGLPPGSGYTGPKTPPGCARAPEQAGVDDVRYIVAVLDDLKTRTAYDARRVYASGWSHGGGMSHRLACELSHRITAIGPVEGTIKIPQCNPTRAVPVIVWGSLGDTTSPFAGGSGDTSVPYTVSVHLSVLNLPPFQSPTSSFVVNSTVVSGATDSVRQWLGGKDGSAVMLHTLSSNLIHSWLNDDPPAFDWQEANWTFFKQYALPGSNRQRAVRH